jgi:hypothetical protein
MTDEGQQSAPADWQSAGAVPLNTFVQRRSEVEIDEQFSLAQDRRPQPPGPLGHKGPEYAAGVDDTIAWLFGMTEDQPLRPPLQPAG